MVFIRRFRAIHPNETLAHGGDGGLRIELFDSGMAIFRPVNSIRTLQVERQEPAARLRQKAMGAGVRCADSSPQREQGPFAATLSRSPRQPGCDPNKLLPLVSGLPEICHNSQMPERSRIRVTAFDHVTLICADLEATRRFYVEVLGMNEVPRPAFRFPGLWFQMGGVQIHATQESPEAGRAGWADQGGKVVSRGHHIAFCVDDVSQALAIVENHGVRIASPLQHRPDGYRQLYLYDPDGHVVELVSQ
jgi:catechol 2,3-dioxygenase-like lactoylglutathione lyase family enzyme